MVHEIQIRVTLKEEKIEDILPKKVSKKLKIPFAKTASYLDLSKNLGKPKSVRAVANANGANAMSIIVPCHRIIGSNGSLKGYAGGLDIKDFLLKHEGDFKWNI